MSHVLGSTFLMNLDGTSRGPIPGGPTGLINMTRRINRNPFVVPLARQVKCSWDFKGSHSRGPGKGAGDYVLRAPTFIDPGLLAALNKEQCIYSLHLVVLKDIVTNMTLYRAGWDFKSHNSGLQNQENCEQENFQLHTGLSSSSSLHLEEWNVDCGSGFTRVFIYEEIRFSHTSTYERFQKNVAIKELEFSPLLLPHLHHRHQDLMKKYNFFDQEPNKKRTSPKRMFWSTVKSIPLIQLAKKKSIFFPKTARSIRVQRCQSDEIGLLPSLEGKEVDFLERLISGLHACSEPTRYENTKHASHQVQIPTHLHQFIPSRKRYSSGATAGSANTATISGWDFMGYGFNHPRWIWKQSQTKRPLRRL
ncbi:hypothetical protein K440DRAFT_644032 [Wilcoxina mikolae CBS 423.85]|nr:hypothetical protein K440DRAFT_644032 [Wilcoxina mikolae CBS 423.85]